MSRGIRVVAGHACAHMHPCIHCGCDCMGAMPMLVCGVVGARLSRACEALCAHVAPCLGSHKTHIPLSSLLGTQEV